MNTSCIVELTFDHIWTALINSNKQIELCSSCIHILTRSATVYIYNFSYFTIHINHNTINFRVNYILYLWFPFKDDFFYNNNIMKLVYRFIIIRCDTIITPGLVFHIYRRRSFFRMFQELWIWKSKQIPERSRTETVLQ